MYCWCASASLLHCGLAFCVDSTLIGNVTAGMSEGLGLGTNTLAALVTRGCSEMTRLAVKMGARPDTVSGPSLPQRSEEHPSELQSLMRLSYAVFCFKNKTQ